MTDEDTFVAREREHWGSVAQAFHEGLSGMTDSCIPPLLDALGDLGGRRVLDVGCGPGHSAAEAARRGGTIIGMDLAPQMVALAAQLWPSIDFRVGDLEALPFPDGSFDAAFGNFVILHVPRPELAVQQLARVLRGGGRLALSTWDVDAKNRVLGMVFEAADVAGIPMVALPGAPARLRFADDPEFETLLRGRGFEDVTIERFEFAFEVPSAEALFTEITKTSLMAKALISSGDTETIERLRRAYIGLAKRYGRNERVSVPCAAKIAFGRKAAGA